MSDEVRACRVIMHVIASLLFGVLSVFLTIFLAYDDAQVRKFQLLPDFDKTINDVENEVEEQQAEDGLVNHIPDLKQLSEDIDKTTNTFINVALELESAIQQYQRAEAQLGGAVTTISKKVDTINQHIDKVLENAPTKLKVSVNINDADWQKIQELFVHSISQSLACRTGLPYSQIKDRDTPHVSLYTQTHRSPYMHLLCGFESIQGTGAHAESLRD